MLRPAMPGEDSAVSRQVQRVLCRPAVVDLPHGRAHPPPSAPCRQTHPPQGTPPPACYPMLYLPRYFGEREARLRPGVLKPPVAGSGITAKLSRASRGPKTGKPREAA